MEDVAESRSRIVLVNAIHLPPGDHSGSESAAETAPGRSFGVRVTRRKPLPSGRIVQRSPLRTKAMRPTDVAEAVSAPDAETSPPISSAKTKNERSNGLPCRK
jgi:hypothetical protein